MLGAAFLLASPFSPSSRNLYRSDFKPSPHVCVSSVSSSSPPSTPTCSASPVSRRAFLRLISSTAFATVSFTRRPSPAQAVNGMHVFPLREKLNNTYYLMRACQTHSDADNLTIVNPVQRMSVVKQSLTTNGVQAASQAANALMSFGVSDDSWIWPSISTSAYETAELIASHLGARQDRIVPEFSFLDARGVGALEGHPADEVRRIIHSNDSHNANWKPQPGEDGTPNDSAQDVFVRIQQLISKLETQYFAEDIIVVSPDSDALSVWQAAVTGHNLEEHPSMYFSPGEIRRVHEVVVDAYGKIVVPAKCETVFKPA